MIRKVEMERFTVISAKPFDEVVAAIKTSIGSQIWLSSGSRRKRRNLPLNWMQFQRVLGRTGLMLFVEFDHGSIVRKGPERHTSRIIRLAIGNPLIMKEMAKDVPDAGSLRLPSLWMSVLMACIFHMTGWPAS